jgi:hypothetical protein
MRFMRTLFPVALLVTLAACGGAATSSSSADDGSNASASSLASSSVTASASADASAPASEDGGGSVDLDQLEDELTPPDSNETSRFDVAGGIAISFQTSASMDDLRSFYEDRFDDLGVEVFASDAGDNGISWVFGDSPAGFAGGVVLSPSGDAITVVVTIGEGG